MANDSLTCDAFGRVAARGIHDATVEELHCVRGDRCERRLRDPFGEMRWLRFEGVGWSGTSDLQSGTVVSDVYRWALSRLTAIEDALRLIVARRRLAPRQTADYTESMVGYRDALRLPGLRCREFILVKDLLLLPEIFEIDPERVAAVADPSGVLQDSRCRWRVA
jgi:hypothetical protein